MPLNLSNISVNCSNIITNNTDTCVYVYGTDYVIVLLTAIAIFTGFVVIYIIYKEIVR